MLDTNVNGVGRVSVAPASAASEGPLFVTVIVYVYVSPGCTGVVDAALTVVITDNGGPYGPAGGIGGDGVFEPPVGEVGVATFVNDAISPVNVGSSCTINVNACVPPGATSLGDAHVTSCPTAVHPSCEDTNVILVGNVSVAPTPAAVEGPALATVIV